jgi:uncharacterized membrane protein
MDKMLIAVFERESQAHAAAGAMNKLAEESLLLIYAVAVIVKDLAKISVVDFKINNRGHSVLGVPTRSLIKLLGAPYDFTDDGNSRVLSDRMIDLANAGVDAIFLDDVTRHLLPGKAAMVCEIEEETTNAMNIPLESQGGTVFRCRRRESMDVQIAKELDALRSEIQTLETQVLQRPEESKPQLQPKLNRARASFEATKDRARQHAASIKREAEAKIVLLQEQIVKANGPSKARLERLADEIRVEYVNRATKLNVAWQSAGDVSRRVFSSSCLTDTPA